MTTTLLVAFCCVYLWDVEDISVFTASGAHEDDHIRVGLQAGRNETSREQTTVSAR